MAAAVTVGNETLAAFACRYNHAVTIQYMGMGIPAVVSPVGANRDVVPDGVCGLHATSEAEWLGALERLVDSAELRNRMGAEGRRRVEQHYSAEVQAPRVGALLKGLRP